MKRRIGRFLILVGLFMLFSAMSVPVHANGGTIIVHYGDQTYEYSRSWFTDLYNIKERAASDINLHPDEQILYLNGQEYDDRTYLSNCGLDDGGEVTLVQAHRLWIGGVHVPVSQPSGEGWSYTVTQPATEDTLEKGVLTLDNATINKVKTVYGNDKNVYCTGIDLTVVLSGENTIGTSEDPTQTAFESSDGSLTVESQNNGKLTAFANVVFWAKNGITVNGGTVTAVSDSEWGYTVYNDTDDEDVGVVINGGDMTLTNTGSCIQAHKVTVNGGTVKATSQSSYGAV